MAKGKHRIQGHAGRMPSPTGNQQQEASPSMPQPLPGWPPVSTHTTPSLSHSLSSDSQEESEQDGVSSSSQPENRRTRGPTWMHGGWGEDGGILEIEKNELGQPIEKKASILSSHLGVLARNGILPPLNYVDWRTVPSLYKDQIWDHIKENTNATDGMRHILMMYVGKKWQEWKHEAKAEGYDPYFNDEEHLAHRPDRVEEPQWRSLVHFWGTSEAKKKSGKSKDSRTHLTMPHTAGTKSFPQVRNEVRAAKKVKKQTHPKNKAS